MRGSSLTDGCLITRMCFDLFDPARVDQPYLLRYRSSIFSHYFNNQAMTCRKYRGNTISVKRWKRRTRNHHKHKKQEREIIYLLLATSCGLYFTRAASLARACSSLAGDPWRRLFFVLVGLHILLECSFKKHEKFGIKLYHLHHSTCLSKAFSQNFRPQKSHCLYLVWRGSIDNCFCFYTIINSFSSVPN